MLESRKENLATSIKKFFIDGLIIEKISLCVSLGIVLGIFPALGFTTVLCTAAAIVIWLNLALIQLVNYAVYPLQLFLLAFFYGIGNWLFNDHSLFDSGAPLIGMLQDDMWGSMTSLLDLTIFAVLLWVFISPVLFAVMSAVLMAVFRKLSPALNASV